MFSYYGSKSKIVDYYPPPKYGKIIEPFAGSARYSLKYFDREIILIDKYEVIVKLWKWLQLCSPSDIMGLPKINHSININTLGLTEEEKYLMGFCIGRGNSYPVNVSGNFQDWEADKKRIAKELYKIKHWNIILLDYKEVQNEIATWFIDPPYQTGGYKYKHHKLSYTELELWCKSRYGQTIVCENTKADWMPFKPMKDMRGVQFKTTEAIWSNYETNYDHVQQALEFTP